MSYILSAAGAAIAVAGFDKLIGNRAYVSMFRHLGWSKEAMRLAALAETVGGTLMVPRRTRQIGGLLVAGASLAVLASELQHRDARLAAPRGAVLLGALAAILLPSAPRG